MLSHMSKSVFNGLVALTIAIPVLAWSRLPVHHARVSLNSFSEYSSEQNGYINYDFVTGKALFSWQQSSLQGFAHIDAKVTDTKAGIGHGFEIKAVRITSTDATTINGEWDVFKNGAVSCAGCKGSVYLSAPGQSNPYMKGYVSNGQVSLSFYGDIDSASRLSY